MDKLNDILIVAGTHGNELSGIYINKLIKEELYSVERSTFSASSIIANQEAMNQNVRFTETDLNREFSSARINANSDLHETHVASQFREKYADKSNQLIIDLHNTTSNMGATLILLTEDPFYTKMGAFVKQQMPEANILFEVKAWEDQAFLCTTGQYGVMIEVGAQAHGSLQYEVLELMKNMLTAVLDYVELHNQNKMIPLKDYHAFYFTEEIHIPVDSEGMRKAMVHPNICGRDFEVVQQGEPLLTTFFGDDIRWEGTSKVYPHFINESAYFKGNIAMALAEKRLVSVN